MTKRYLSDRDKTHLETEFVDKTDLYGVLIGLAEIAYAKADHILTTYGDRKLASDWTHDARALERAAQKLRSPG